jgi:teichuronic acid exporter
MEDNIKHKAINALSWSFLDAVAQRGVQFVIGIILARLLFPEQFGLIGMLAIFIAVAQSFLDSGFGAALIQKRDATQTDTASIFYFNIFIGLMAAGLVCLIAPWIAAFYKQPILTPLMRAMSLVIVINSFGLIQGTLLTKEINFKTQTKVGLIAGILSGSIGVTLAAVGFGVWSLAIQQISNAFFRTVFLWYFSPWRPTLLFSLKSLMGMYSFGSRLLLSDVINRIFDNIYLVVIGKLFSAVDLGLFTRAKTLQDIPSQTLPEVVGRVSFPVFSTIQDDPAKLKRGLKRALTTLVLVNFPMMIGLAAIARPLVLVMLTEKWNACIPYFQLLCISSLLYPVHLMNLNVLQALGRSDLFLRLEIIKKIMIVINIAVTWRWGISAIIYGIIFMSIIAYYLNSYYTGVLIGYPLREQLNDLFPYLFVAILMGIAVYAAGLVPFPGHWSLLLGQIITGSFIYICLCRTFRLRAFMDSWQSMWIRLSLMSAGITR